MLLDSKKWKYKPYRDPRYDTVEDFAGGFSGDMFLATAKDGKKYLIKHGNMSFAANEFVASNLADKMGLPVAKAYLLKPDKRLSSQYAVAIEFIDGLETFGYKELSEQEKREAVAQIYFSVMIGNLDFAQLRRCNGRIVQIDFAESFNMSGMLLEMAFKMNQPAMIEQFLNNSRDGFIKNAAFLDFDLSFLAEDLDMDPAKINEIVEESAKRLLNVTEEDVQEIEDNLLELYPTEFVANYVADIHALLERIKEL